MGDAGFSLQTCEEPSYGTEPFTRSCWRTDLPFELEDGKALPSDTENRAPSPGMRSSARAMPSFDPCGSARASSPAESSSRGSGVLLTAAFLASSQRRPTCQRQWTALCHRSCKQLQCRRDGVTFLASCRTRVRPLQRQRTDFGLARRGRVDFFFFYFFGDLFFCAAGS